MLTQFALASAESALNRVLQLDSTAQARLAPLAGKVIAIACSMPAITVYLIPLETGIQLAKQWHAPADCTLTAPATLLLKLASSADKTSVLHHPEVSIDGNSALLMELAEIMQSLELDWEYESITLAWTATYSARSVTTYAAAATGSYNRRKACI